MVGLFRYQVPSQDFISIDAPEAVSSCCISSGADTNLRPPPGCQVHLSFRFQVIKCCLRDARSRCLQVVGLERCLHYYLIAADCLSQTSAAAGFRPSPSLYATHHPICWKCSLNGLRNLALTSSAWHQACDKVCPRLRSSCEGVP